MNYVVEVSFNQVLFIDADTKDEASDLAQEQFEEMYGLVPGQCSINSIEKVK